MLHCAEDPFVQKISCYKKGEFKMVSFLKECQTDTTRFLRISNEHPHDPKKQLQSYRKPPPILVQYSNKVHSFKSPTVSLFLSPNGPDYIMRSCLPDNMVSMTTKCSSPVNKFITRLGITHITPKTVNAKERPLRCRTMKTQMLYFHNYTCTLYIYYHLPLKKIIQGQYGIQG